MRHQSKLLFFSLLPQTTSSFALYTTQRSIYIPNQRTRTMSTAVDHTDKEGAFKRKQSKHRFSIKKDSDIYKAEPDRYHLHIALACPWANGVLATVR